MKIDIHGKTITCHVQYSKRTKIAMQMDGSQLLTIKVPNGTTEDTITSMVIKHSDWILQKSMLFEKALEQPKAKTYEQTEKVLHLGKEYDLHELIDTADLTSEELRKSLKKFYYNSLKKIVGERIKLYQTQLKVKPKSFEIIESTKKWGSCSSDRTLTFNYRLAMAPLEVIDYVIIHELCHLHHMNHDRSFWRRVGSIMPDYEEKEKYLARRGQFMTL